ncbi:MAG: hypothetical protein JWO44_1366 [Bacteroidetes bacterium]|jgi:uncharacterized protein YndB with AHSA1/START domain|nr:hypothetical protein [Bacteroidota bacterium]
MKNNITGKAGIRINAPVEKTWEALTKPELIKKYFFGTDTKTDWKPGSPITFSGEWQGKKYEDKGTVIDVQENKLIKYKYWSEMSGIADKPENYVTITYELSEENGKTTLMITQENIPTEEMKQHSEENWKKVLNNLKEMLEEKSVSHL